MLALVFLGYKPQTAPVERLFEKQAAQQTEARNRTTLSMLDMITAVNFGCEGAAEARADRPRPSINRALDPTERSRENCGPAGDAPPVPAAASDGGETEDDDSDEPVVQAARGPCRTGRPCFRT